MKTDLINHLESRHMDLSLYPNSVSVSGDLTTFYLWNLSGQLLGYQDYNYKSMIKQSNEPREARYFSYTSRPAVWGLEFDMRGFDYVFLVEGVFNAARLHKAGCPAIAMLGSNPVDMKSFLKCLPQRKIVIAEDGKAGKMLIKYGDRYVQLLGNEDVGDLDENNFQILLTHILKGV
jgi:hypothetical protein